MTPRRQPGQGFHEARWPFKVLQGSADWADYFPSEESCQSRSTASFQHSAAHSFQSVGGHSCTPLHQRQLHTERGYLLFWYIWLTEKFVPGLNFKHSYKSLCPSFLRNLRKLKFRLFVICVPPVSWYSHRHPKSLLRPFNPRSSKSPNTA